MMVKRKATSLYASMATIITLNIAMELAAPKVKPIAASSQGHEILVSINPWMTNIVHGQSPLDYHVMFSTGCGHVTLGCFFFIRWAYLSCGN